MANRGSNIANITLPLPALSERDSGGGSLPYAGTGPGGGAQGRSVRYLTDEALEEATGVRFAFSFRTGGVSPEPYGSLNMGRRVGDEPSNVDRNVDLLLDAMGIGDLADRVVNPVQTHGTDIVHVVDAPVAPRYDDRCDAVVTRLPNVPVMLCYADCVPVVLVAPDGGFSVVHSGWRGTLGRISRLSLEHLCRISGCEPGQVNAYIGPHIGRCCYEVDEELRHRFSDAFGSGCICEGRHLDLGYVVHAALLEAGADAGRIADAGICTADNLDICYSHRAERGRTGRFCALCCRVL